MRHARLQREAHTDCRFVHTEGIVTLQLSVLQALARRVPENFARGNIYAVPIHCRTTAVCVGVVGGHGRRGEGSRTARCRDERVQARADGAGDACCATSSITPTHQHNPVQQHHSHGIALAALPVCEGDIVGAALI